MPRSAAPVIACRKKLCTMLTDHLQELIGDKRLEEYNAKHVGEAVRIITNALARTHG